MSSSWPRLRRMPAAPPLQRSSSGTEARVRRVARMGALCARGPAHSGPFSPLFTGVRGRSILRTSPKRRSRKFSPWSFYDPACVLPPGVVSRLGDLHAVRFEGDAVGVRSAAHSGVERVDRGALLAGELASRRRRSSRRCGRAWSTSGSRSGPPAGASAASPERPTCRAGARSHAA
jgi:hypothetical protein